MRILLTGGAGFIGSACLVRFLQQEWEVVVIDSFESTLYERAIKERHLAWARAAGEHTFVEADIRDSDALAELFGVTSFDCVVHLAAVAGVRPSIEKAAHYMDVNVTGTARLLRAARNAGVSDFVLASSSSVYGGNEKVPFAESDRVDSPVSPYAASKVAMEALASADNHLHGGNTTCLRFFTVYGPRQRPEMAIHKFFRLMANDKPIPMFGDGTSGRDYTYIDDIIDGVMAAVRHLDGFRIYNLGGDEVIRLADLVQTIADIVGVQPEIDRQTMQPGDMLLTSADLTLARRELGYQPGTILRAGLEATWAWVRSEE